MSNTTTPDRVIRVFVSSTFRDMQEDRDYLVKLVFPQLRRLCEARGVTWGEVDLRWGISEGQSERGEVFLLCRQERNDDDNGQIRIRSVADPARFHQLNFQGHAG